MEEIVEPILRVIWAVTRFILWQILFYTVMFNIGRVFLLLFTLGNYPWVKHIETDAEKIALFGFFLVFLVWSALAFYNNANT
jgi:hypothetical protein